MKLRVFFFVLFFPSYECSAVPTQRRLRKGAKTSIKTKPTFADFIHVVLNDVRIDVKTQMRGRGQALAKNTKTKTRQK